MGVLGGAALLNYAYETMFRAFELAPGNERVIRAVRIMAEKTGIYGMLGGQSVDVENDGKPLTKELLDYIYEHKTAALLEASMMVGAVLGLSLIHIFLADSFFEAGNKLYQTILWMMEFMKVLAPAYFITVAAASGAVSAAVFYEGILILVWLLQWVLLNVLLPAADLYVLLCLVNHLSREEMLGKLSDLLAVMTSWGLKTLLGTVAGLQILSLIHILKKRCLI